MATIQEMKNWLGSYERNWNQLCQALMWQLANKFGSAPVTYSSAIVAYSNSSIVSRNALEAPAGAIHYWDIGADGHVAVELGGGLILMGSSKIQSSWGNNVGTTTVSAYNNASGAKYLGWARTNGRNTIPVSGGSSTAGGTSGSVGSYSKADGVTLQRIGKIFGAYSGPLDGEPGVNTWIGVQNALKNKGLYSGPADGEPGENTFKGLQELAKQGSYSGPVDGDLGPKTFEALYKLVESIEPTSQPVSSGSYSKADGVTLQRIGKIFGAYSGPLDGEPGVNTWIGVQNALKNKGLYSGPADGEPGENTFKGLQELAKQGSYSGPVDGDLGPKTFEALYKLVESVEPTTTPNAPSNPVIVPPVAVEVPFSRPSVGSVGNDIATPQKGFDFDLATKQGSQFIIVKASGLNVLPQYVAPNYKAQIDSIVSRNIPKGHYYLIGAGQTPEQQADYFVSNLHKFNKANDVLMLDNEKLDSNGTLWKQDSVVSFVNRVISQTGINPKRVWVYMGANDTRSNGPWDKLVNIGVRFVWAAYGNSPKSFTPDHTPDLKGSIPEAHIHQFTSSMPIGGMSAVDGLYSKYSLNELFNLDNHEEVKPPVIKPPVVVPPVVTVPTKNTDLESLIIALEKVLKEYKAKI